MSIPLVNLDVLDALDLEPLLLDDWASGGLFVPTRVAVSAGGRLAVHLRVGGLSAGHILQGEAQWRRSRSVANARGAAATTGVGLRLLPEHATAFAFLRAWCKGVVGESGRVSTRWPIDVACLLIVQPQKSRTMLRMRAVDISEGGTRLRAVGGEPLPRGLLTATRSCVLEVPLGRSATFVFPCKSVWQIEHELGLAIAFGPDPTLRSSWDDVRRRAVEGPMRQTVPVEPSEPRAHAAGAFAA